MGDQQSLVSNVFQTFASEAPSTQRHGVSLFKTSLKQAPWTIRRHLWYIWQYLQPSASRVAYHFMSFPAKKAGASREEVISAILAGLPLAGNVVTQMLPTALAAYDAE